VGIKKEGTGELPTPLRFIGIALYSGLLAPQSLPEPLKGLGFIRGITDHSNVGGIINYEHLSQNCCTDRISIFQPTVLGCYRRFFYILNEPLGRAVGGSHKASFGHCGTAFAVLGWNLSDPFPIFYTDNPFFLLQLYKANFLKKWKNY
jgi:hypothetical protein